MKRNLLSPCSIRPTTWSMNFWLMRRSLLYPQTQKFSKKWQQQLPLQLKNWTLEKSFWKSLGKRRRTCTVSNSVSLSIFESRTSIILVRSLTFLKRETQQWRFGFCVRKFLKLSDDTVMHFCQKKGTKRILYWWQFQQNCSEFQQSIRQLTGQQ